MPRLISRAVPLVALLTASAVVTEARETPPSVLNLTIDSLRTDRLRPWNPEAPASTPNLEKLAGRGTVFTNAWAVTPWTAPSVVSVFTGLYPPSHGVVHRDDTTPDDLPTLARMLAARGYRLGNFSFFSGISYFQNLGFPSPPLDLGHQHAAQIFARWLTHDEPFLAWIHLIEPHLPYGASGYRARKVTVAGSSGLEAAQLRAEVPIGSVEFVAGDRDRLVALYDHDLEAMDRMLGKILGALEQQGMTESTIIVVVADHGEELLDEGWIGHASTALQAKLIPEILHIPLLIAGPDFPAGIISDTLVQQTDIMPTLCRMLDLPIPVSDGVPIRWKKTSTKSKRDEVFFDCSAAGNLTPSDRRSERLQGVANKRCLFTVHTIPELPPQKNYRPIDPAVDSCSSWDQRRLTRKLRRWQRQQARQRLTILKDLGKSNAPSDSEIASCEERIRVLAPADGEHLEWSAAAGQITLAWTPSETPCWVEYRIGTGAARVSGIFRATGSPQVFGPFPEGFWNDLAHHNPFTFRILCPGDKMMSPWVDFTLTPVP